MTRKKQNYELSLFKFIFSIIIVLYHSHRFFSNDTTYILGSGWSGTEFFFIVSGYLMAVSSRKYSEKPLGASTFDFIMKKIKSIYPFYIIAFLLTFAVRQFAFSLKRDLYIFEDFLISINEMLLLQDSGITFKRIYNGPTWYISAMIIAMMVLFPLLLKFKEWYTNIGGLTISVFIYAYIAQNVYSVNNAVTWLNITTVGILRAIAALSLGAFLYGLVNRIKERNFAFTKSGKTLMLLSELGAFILLIWIMQNLRSLNGKYQFDFIMIILIFYICFLVFSELTQINTILPAKLCAFLGELSLPIFLFHRAIIYFYTALEIDLPKNQYLFLYLATIAVLVAVAYFVLYICRLIRKKLGQKTYEALVLTNLE